MFLKSALSWQIFSLFAIYPLTLFIVGFAMLKNYFYLVKSISLFFYSFWGLYHS